MNNRIHSIIEDVWREGLYRKVAGESKRSREDNSSIYEQCASQVLVLTAMNGDAVYSIRMIPNQVIGNGCRRRARRLHFES